MMPYFTLYLMNHAVAHWIGAVIAGGVIFLVLALSGPYLHSLQVYACMLAFVGCGAFEIARDAAGYWTYCARLAKFYGPAPSSAAASDRLIRSFGNPFVAALAAFAVSSGAIGIAHLYRATHPLVLAAVLMIGWMPLCIATLAVLTGLACVRSGNPADIPSSARKSQRRILIEDLLLVGVINATVLWSMQRNGNFSVAAGYDSSTLIISTTVLLVVITLLCVLGAWRSRLYTLVGELMQDTTVDGVAAVGRRLNDARKSKRLAGYLLLAFLWAPLCCAVLAAIDSTPRFSELALLLMLPVPIIYLRERTHTLANDMTDARNFLADQARWSSPMLARLQPAGPGMAR